MGLTNIRYPNEFFERAGGMSQQALLADVNKFIQLGTSSTSEAQADVHMKLLQSGLLNKWFSMNVDQHSRVTYEVKPSPAGVRIPKLCLSQVFRERSFPQTVTSNAGARVSLAYVLVSQGADAAQTTKVDICCSLEETGEAIMSAALNGFDIVFGAAIHSRAADALIKLSSERPGSKEFAKLRSARFLHVKPEGLPLSRFSGRAPGDVPQEYLRLMDLTDVMEESEELRIPFLH